MAINQAMTKNLSCISVLALLLLGCAQRGQKPTPDGRMENAIRQGDTKTVRALLQAGYDLNSAPQWKHSGHWHDSETPLSLAVRPPQFEIVEFLLASGADVNARNSDGSTALFWAIQAGESGAKIVTLLLDRGADLNIKANDGTTPLNEARKALLPELEMLLLRRGAKDPFIDAVIWIPVVRIESDGRKRLARGMSFGNRVESSLVRAAGDGDLEGLRKILDAPTELNVGDPSVWGCSAVAIAAIRNKREALEYLLTLGANPNAPNKMGATPLMLAAATQTVAADIFQTLISHGADINARDNAGNVAEDYAIVSGNTNSLKSFTKAESK